MFVRVPIQIPRAKDKMAPLAKRKRQAVVGKFMLLANTIAPVDHVSEISG
jgi:hypothetical protein